MYDMEMEHRYHMLATQYDLNMCLYSDDDFNMHWWTLYY